MKHIVVIDEAKAHKAHQHSYRLHPHLAKALPMRPLGTIHTSIEGFECPDGLPNCRNCGDPAHAESCKAAGHCPHCGTAHGVAPDAVLAANGYGIIEG